MVIIRNTRDHTAMSLEGVYYLAFHQIPKIDTIVLRARYDECIVGGKTRIDLVFRIRVTLKKEKKQTKNKNIYTLFVPQMCIQF